MATTITLNGTSLQTANIVTNTIQHDSSAPHVLNTSVTARGEGEVLVTANTTAKVIKLTGTIVGSSQSDLETKLDAFKQTVEVTNGTLDIAYAGGTRRYTVSLLGSVVIERQSYHISAAPFSLEFKVHTGFGAATADTNLVSGFYLSADNSLVTVNNPGTAVSYPLVNYASIDQLGGSYGVELTNYTTGQKIYVPSLPVPVSYNLDSFSIDSENALVLRKGKMLQFLGEFPHLAPGNNVLGFRTLYTSGLKLNQQQLEHDSTANLHVSIAQSFSVAATTKLDTLAVLVGKVGSPSGSCTISVQTDNAGAPSGTELYSANVATSSILNEPTWVEISPIISTALAANTKYWIVLSNSGADAKNYCYVRYSNKNPISTGAGSVAYGMSRNDEGTAWTAYPTADMSFKLYTNDFDQSMRYLDSSYSYTTTALNTSMVAQKFTTGTGVTALKSLDLYYKNANAADATPYVAIYSDNGGVPGDELVACPGENGKGQTFAHWHRFVPTVQASLFQNTAFWIVATGVNCTFYGSNVSRYSGGSAASYAGGNWTVLANNDLNFATYQTTPVKNMAITLSHRPRYL